MKKSYQKTIFVVVLVLIPLSCAGAAFWVLAEFRAAEENWNTTDLLQYPEIRKGWHNNKFIKHFPEQIPTNATDIHLFYSPPFLQKGALFQLWFKLPVDEIEKLEAKYKEVVSKNDTVEIHLMRAYPALNMYTNDNPEGKILPLGYEIIVLGAESKDQGNHGHTYGVAINKSSSEIFYWAETW